jgi:hypothetical protein
VVDMPGPACGVVPAGFDSVLKPSSRAHRERSLTGRSSIPQPPVSCVAGCRPDAGIRAQSAWRVRWQYKTGELISPACQQGDVPKVRFDDGDGPGHNSEQLRKKHPFRRCSTVQTPVLW